MLDPLELLAEEDRAAVTRWLWRLGMEPEELEACSPLRQVVEVLACAGIVDTLHPPMSKDTAWCEAAGQLGLGDGPRRRWYRWQAAAVELNDNLSDG